jgi:hypothetical protein
MTTGGLKLYHSTSSPNSRRVRIFVAEKGLNLSLVPIDLGKGEQHSDAYRAIIGGASFQRSSWKTARQSVK